MPDMRFTVANFRGAEESTVHIREKMVDLLGNGKVEPVTLTVIAGTNFQGKTSTAQAITALLTGEPKIYPEIKKKTLKELVMDGKEQAMATLESDDYTAKITYPECHLETEGNPISASRMAMGLESFVDMDVKGRLRYYCDIMEAEPSKEQLEEALKDVLDKDSVDKLWENIAGLGWDAAFLHAEEKGRGLKSKWKSVTGEGAWGIKKGETWLPSQWSPELMNATIERLQSDYEGALSWYNAGLQQSALDEAKLNELQGFADNIDNQKAAVDVNIAQIDDVKTKMVDIRKKIDKLITTKSVQGCPYCGETIETKNGVYVKSSKKKAPADIDGKIAAEQSKYDELDEKLAQLYRTHGKNDTLYKECVAAQETIKKHNESIDKGVNDLDKAAADLAKAELNLNLFNQKTEASETHERIKGNVAIVKVLAPNGLRLTTLTDTLANTNSRLKGMCEILGWGAVSIESDMTIKFVSQNGHYGVHQFTSKSEQYRIRATLQLYFARAEKAPLVMFDEFEMLDNAGRNGMIKMLMMSNTPALIVMTLNDKKTAKDAYSEKDTISRLAQRGASVFWMKGGRSYELK